MFYRASGRSVQNWGKAINIDPRVQIYCRRSAAINAVSHPRCYLDRFPVEKRYSSRLLSHLAKEMRESQLPDVNATYIHH